MENIETVQLDLIIERCLSETRRYKDTGQGDWAFCYELFRRALSDDDQEAFSKLYNIYKPRLEAWARAHSLTALLKTSPEICASDTLIRVWKYLGGEKFREKVSSHPQLLVYLRKTLNTVILEEYRKQKSRVTEVGMPLFLANEPAQNPQYTDLNVPGIVQQNRTGNPFS